MKHLKAWQRNKTWIEERLYFHDTTNQANNVRLVYYVESGEFVYLGKFLFFAYTTAFQPNKSLDGKHIPWHISDKLNELIHQFGWIRNEILDKWGMVSTHESSNM